MSPTADEAPQPFVCRNCGRRYEDEEADRHGWCAACRQLLVRRATTWAWGPAAVVAAAFVAVLAATGGFYSRFLVGYLAVGALLAWGVFKVARRVFFDVFRARGVPAPVKEE
ncbi:MAG TPA: hypothetical protein VFX98_17230 [Longimicrobiaceae bacterium]|nr:hypothetical protein [Longimicrobiaceae bacterium]